jgi:hypothetical protein
MPLVNASRLWIPETDEMIEIMQFSVIIFVMGVSGPSSLDAAQTPEWGYSKEKHDSFLVTIFTKSVAW